MKREYKCECEVGKPQVNFRETITGRAAFDYLHKKQSGGQGQYGRVIGYMEPLPDDATEKFEFKNGMIGNNIPPGFVAAIEKGFREAANSGALIGHPVEGARVVLTDGAAHAVDSNELAFRLAALHAFRQGYERAGPVVLEPIMSVEVRAPAEFQGTIIGGLNRWDAFFPSPFYYSTCLFEYWSKFDARILDSVLERAVQFSCPRMITLPLRVH